MNFKFQKVVFLIPQIKQVMKTAAKHQSEPYEVALVNWENEQMNYSYGE